jgi:hypothetical protein
MKLKNLVIERAKRHGWLVIACLLAANGGNLGFELSLRGNLQGAQNPVIRECGCALPAGCERDH